MSQSNETESAQLSFGDLNKLIEDKATSLFQQLVGKKDDDKPTDTPKTTEKKEETIDLDSQVQAAINRLKEDEERKTKETERDATIKALVEKTKEKAPVERRRVHKIMGWGE
jgi:hypothetical protein